MSRAEPIRLVLSDVDGTLVDSDKQLSEAAVAAVGHLADAGILFAVTSGRPPRGMSMLVEPLGLTTPLAAFNGGEFVTPQLDPVDTKDIADALVPSIVQLLVQHHLDVWVYSGADWYVGERDGAHVERESRTVGFSPTVLESFEAVTSVAKLVGVSEDHAAVARAEADARERFGDEVSAARSQPYYLDVTHPEANKGAVVKYLSRRYDVPPESIATLGDMPNDVLMFAHCGLSIAMGNASGGVQRAARRVTRSNDDDGFAYAIERFVLGGS